LIGGVVNSINAQELKKLKDNNKNFTLLDVRENDELSIAKIDPHKHIPMGEIQGRHDELNKNELIVVMCHGGFRSARVCKFLNNEGYNAINFTGGIRSWSSEIDPSVPQY
jgi:rhodanese-related sulfurtransferase|tara:strand:+ start:175 stop:504 length:330 start_codon:yes stop_codon:yes gene_type:complete